MPAPFPAENESPRAMYVIVGLPLGAAMPRGVATLLLRFDSGMLEVMRDGLAVLGGAFLMIVASVMLLMAGGTKGFT